MAPPDRRDGIHAPISSLFLVLTGDADVSAPSSTTEAKTRGDDHSERVLVRDYPVNGWVLYGVFRSLSADSFISFFLPFPLRGVRAAWCWFFRH